MRTWLVGAVLILVALLSSSFYMIEFLDAKHVMVIQYPNGTMETFTEPGPKWQMFGNVTLYPRRVTFNFSNDNKLCKQFDADGFQPFKVQFNDGGEAALCGSLQWEMPVKPDQLVRLQKDYSSVEAIDQQLVKAALNNAIYFAGPTMSSIESNADRKSEFLQYIEDQLRNGVYKVSTRSEKQKDEITGIEKTIRVVEIQRDKNGLPERAAPSAFHEYGIQTNTLAISEIHYDDAVKKQIQVRQDSINSVQVAIANARKAEQEKLTTEAQGAANAAKAKWEQETIKAKVVTEAQQKLEVATLDAAAAAQYKKEQILRGEGDSERRRLLMASDGALDQKLEALVKINGYYASALKEYKGAWVPSVTMGASSGNANQGMALVEMLTAKTARDLGIDLGVSGKGATAK